MRLPQVTRKKARIEIIPMIDAIFFLLVFFMFSSLSMVKMNGLPVALPKAPPTATPSDNTNRASSVKRGTATANPVTSRRLILGIQPGNSLIIDGATINSNEALIRALTTRLRSNPDAVVVVRAASGVSAQRLVGVMDALNRVTLPEGKRPQIVVATVATPPTNRTNVLSVPRAKGDTTHNVR